VWSFVVGWWGFSELFDHVEARPSDGPPTGQRSAHAGWKTCNQAERHRPDEHSPRCAAYSGNEPNHSGPDPRSWPRAERLLLQGESAMSCASPELGSCVLFTDAGTKGSVRIGGAIFRAQGRKKHLVEVKSSRVPLRRRSPSITLSTRRSSRGCGSPSSSAFSGLGLRRPAPNRSTVLPMASKACGIVSQESADGR
jgi:hypothetical protein